MNQDKNEHNQQHQTLDEKVEMLSKIYSELGKELIEDIFNGDGDRNILTTRKMLDNLTADAHKNANAPIAKPIDKNLIDA